jgi:cell division protein FtsB
MAKNRKNQSAAIRFGPAIKALLICSLFVVSGVGYVWQKSQIADLDRRIKERETALAQLRDTNKKLRDQIAALHSPAMLNQRLIELKLGLGLPQPAQVWRLPEPPEASGDPGAARQIAAR